MPVPTSARFGNLTFATNPLNKYDSVDYRLRLTMLKAEDALYHDPSRGYVLAESATTSRFIFTDMVLNQNYSLRPDTRSAFMANGVITVLDPGGLRFFDAIAGAGVSLGAKNPVINCRYLIEVEFVGTLPDGKVQTETERGVMWSLSTR